MPRRSLGRSKPAAAAWIVWTLAAGACATPPPTAQTPDGAAARTVPRQELCVTAGEIAALPDDRLRIDLPEVRAVVRAATPQAAEIRFTYGGPTADTKPLGSGEVRRQIGLKLRAEDGCNLVYVMWRIAPKDEVVVSVKRNPGQETSAQCGNRGYTNVEPRRGAPPPPVDPGSEHVLRAELAGHELRAWSDGAPVWEGALGPAIDAFDGPVGLRSDNVKADLELRVGGGPAGPLSPLPARLLHDCVAEESD